MAVVAGIPAVAGDMAKLADDDDGVDDSDVVEMAELTNAGIAQCLAAFIDKLGTPWQCVGISAYILLSLAYRIQVSLWFEAEEQNVLHMGHHSYWSTDVTNAYFHQHAPYHGISCQMTKEEGVRFAR